jgi:hypothetical protein
MKKDFKLVSFETLVCGGGEGRRIVELFGGGIEAAGSSTSYLKYLF